MNLLTLQRYRNEIILLLSLLFVIGAFFYKFSANSDVQKNKTVTEKKISEFKAIEKYKKQWASKGMVNKVKIFKTIVSASKVKKFSKKPSKLIVSYSNLNANELNKVTNKLLNLPIQIVNLKIKESSKNQFTMEFTCKW